MKISPAIFSTHHRQRGSAVVFMTALLAIMMMLAAANSNTLLHLHRELNLLEHRQIERLNVSQTNATMNVLSPAKTESK